MSSSSSLCGLSGDGRCRSYERVDYALKAVGLIYASCADCWSGYALFMLSRGEQIVADVNDTVVVDCRFQETTDDRFNLFDNPVHWSKSQLDEHSQINMMVNLVRPFSQVDQGRLRVSFAGTSPNYTMTLVIARSSHTARLRLSLSFCLAVSVHSFVHSFMLAYKQVDRPQLQ